MANRKQQHILRGPLYGEIQEFISFKRQSGSKYNSSEYALRAFDRFCGTAENQALSPQQLADAWCMPDDDKPKYDDGCCVRQLGQYLTEIGHSRAFTVLSAKRNTPKRLGVKPSCFSEEIKSFVSKKKSEGRKYITGEYCLKAFDKFSAMRANEFLSSQQIADAWRSNARGNNNKDISTIREFGIYLTAQGSAKSFVIPYSNGDLPKPAFSGYVSSFARELESFLEMKRSIGLKYRHEELRLKDFDIFCNERPDLSPQQLATAFLHHQKKLSCEKGKRSVSVIRNFGNYLADSVCTNAFTIADENYVAGPYAGEIETFAAFKRACGYKYHGAKSHLRGFDVFCASEENRTLTPQQLADKWILKRGDEHPNTRAGRVGPVRVFGKYLKSIGHPKAFDIADDAAQGRQPHPPYLFSEDDIDKFFAACAELGKSENDPYLHIVLPAAFLFMHCMGVRTCELEILIENVDFDTGKVVIADAKNGDRVMYMSKELSEFLFRYNLEVERVLPQRKHLFPASLNRPRNDFSRRFREIWTANVSDAGRGIPRLYDLRHHFLYRNVELCLRNGGDVNVMRPYVMRHMGHKLPDSFQYYFHLSPPIQKEVSKIKNDLDWMIPEALEAPYE